MTSTRTSSDSLKPASDLQPLFDPDRAQRLMAGDGLDLLLASRRHNVAYLTDRFGILYWDYPEVAHCLEREDDGCEAPYYFAGVARNSSIPPFVVAHQNRAYVFKGKGWITDVRPCCDLPGQKPAIDCLVDALRERGLEEARIGVEMNHLPARVLMELMERLPEAHFTDARSTLWKMRSVKTPRELERQRQAYRIGEEVYRQVFRLVRERPGLTVNEVRGAQMETATRAGCPPLHFGYVKPQNERGKRAWSRDNTGATLIEPGDILFLDLGLIWQGYTTDFGRVAVLGRASTEVRAAYEKMRRCREAIAAAIRPGVKASDVFAAGARFRSENGLPAREGLGHSLGIECHEPPVLSPHDHTVIEEGMTLVIELVDGVGGIAFLLEDAGLVTAEGWKSLTTLSADLVEIC
ncbi:MAG: aminopeptidase P family protein [Planctomycetes bacterium]|nr:aminopeptidase P family protein [Planctomycetota bacterium]